MQMGFEQVVLQALLILLRRRPEPPDSKELQQEYDAEQVIVRELYKDSLSL